MAMINRLLLTYLANSLWMACAIAGISMASAKLLRRGPTAFAHVIWVSALAAATFLPVVSLFHSSAPSGAVTAAVEGGGQHHPAADVPQNANPPRFSLYGWHRSRSFPLSPFLAWLLVACYGTFVAYRGVRLCWAWKQTNRIRRAAYSCPFPESVSGVVARCFGLLGIPPVSILCSSAIQGPLTLGIRRPVLIVPEKFFSQCTESDLSSAFCHEAAHIRRHDFLLNLIYEILLLPLSYHPCAIFIKSRIDHSREMACDEAAAKLLTPQTYARSLLSIARSMSARPSAASGYALGLFDTNALEERIMILLDKTNRLSKSRGRMAGIGAVGCLILVSLAASAFSFQPAQPAVTDGNPPRTGPYVTVSTITFTATAIDKTEMDLDAFARQIESLKNLRPKGWLDEVKERTRDFWQTHGFFKAEVAAESKLLSATDDHQVFSVAAQVNAGAQYRLKSLKFSGATVFTMPELEGMIPIRPGEIFSTAQVRKGLDAMRAAYLSKGYKEFIPVPDTAIDDSTHTITLALKIAEGRLSK